MYHSGSDLYHLLLAVAKARRLSAGGSAGHEHQAASKWVQGRFERRYTCSNIEKSGLARVYGTDQVLSCAEFIVPK